MRRLFTKRQKAALWYEAEGLCERCHQPIAANSFHGDHVTPFAAGGSTTINNGAALCARCNREKGMGMLRSHQQKVQNIVRSIRAGKPGDVLLADIHPGGGKSALPMIVAKELMRNRIDKLCWVVPRTSLQKQAAQSSLDTYLRSAIGHSFEFRESTNDADPSRGLAGFATTYQALGVDRGRDRIAPSEFARHRYALILDEPHHVLAESDWHSQLQPLWDAAAYRVLMTGTMTRGDKKPVAFLQYGEDGQPITDADGWDYVRYTRTDALHEKAIIPLSFSWGQGSVEWVALGSGEVRKARLEDSADGEVRQAIQCALKSDYALHMIERAVDDWRGYRASVYKGAQMIVVAPDQATARAYASALRKMAVPNEIVTSDEGEAAQRRIDAFKAGKVPAIVTVAMAYEGLDVKSATHIVGLTHYRSAPWIEQMLNRVTRFDPAQGAWEKQHAFAYLPDDQLMRQIVSEIEREQDAALREMKIPREPGSGPGPVKEEIKVISGAMTGTRAQGLDDGLHIDAQEDGEIRELMKESGIDGILPTQKLAQVIRLHEMRKTQPSEPYVAPQPPHQTARERETAKRVEIHEWAKKRDAELDLEWGSSNRWLIEVFGKPRPKMTEPELDAVLSFIARHDGGGAAGRAA